MLTPSNRPALVNLSLSFADQQTQILGLTAGRYVPASERLPRDSLTLQFGEKLQFAGVPLCAELEAAEDASAELLADVVPSGEGAKLLLLGPGTSKTDPLYALRFLAKLSVRTDRSGEVAAYDLNNNPDIFGYYDNLPWGSHQKRLELGETGNFELISGQAAHLALAIHPGNPIDSIFGVFAENLVKGGIGLYQGGVNEALVEDEDIYASFLTEMMAPHEKALEFTQPPSPSRLFRSYFSERSSHVHFLSVRRK